MSEEFYEGFLDYFNKNPRPKKDLLEKTQFFFEKWFWDKPISLYNNITNGLYNLYFYLPIIWGDRGWDHYYIYALFKKKLEHQRKCLEKNDYFVGCKRECKRIRVCEILLDRLMNDDYPLPDYIQERIDNGQKYRVEKNKLGVTFIDHSTKQHRRFTKKWYQHQAYQREQDKEYLFKIMNKHIEKWWD